MEKILSTLKSVDFDWSVFGQTSLFLVACAVVLGLLAKFLFGAQSNLTHSISSSIEILFVYAATVVFYAAGGKFEAFIAPLPFITIEGETLTLFSFAQSEFPAICSQVLSMVILAFLANLVDRWTPTGQNLFTWVFFRCVTIALAIALHLGATWIFANYMPDVIVTYAPTILLVLLVTMLLVGALKLLVGLVLATVHPLIGAFYTFFFASFVGKALSRAMLTTLILSLTVIGLNHIGVTAISIVSAALVAYVPLLILLLIAWYIFTRLL